MLLRVVAVVTSSVATVISTWLPLLIHHEFSMWRLLFLLALLILGAFLIHGALTHVFNDITDFESGTDQHSPALLSGGSRVIQSGVMSVGTAQEDRSDAYSVPRGALTAARNCGADGTGDTHCGRHMGGRHRIHSGRSGLPTCRWPESG